ncbi:MAG: DUF2946 family protein [Roseovarius sp.]|nr:DUF2946 family protein [Roseovarius sp.]
MGHSIARLGWGGILSPLLALLLSVQVATAFLPVAGQGDGLELVLCTGDGERAVTLAPDGAPVPKAPAKGHCPLCIVAATLAPGVAPLSAPVRAALTYRFPVAPAPQTSGRLHGRPDAIRAPPVIV